jgi:hypothetical protein
MAAMKAWTSALMGAALLGTSPAFSADASRGGLLYENACGQCHSTQPHWREKRLVRSWDDLVYQVDRWQRVARQNWSADDVRDVASHLNGRFYHLPCAEQGCLGPSASAADR